MKPSELGELLGAKPHPLASALESWLRSRRFATFVRGHRPKIRKKLRGANDPETARDLLLELAAAHRLTTEKRLSVTYEPTAGAASRGPDFAVWYTTRSEFMLEVTRLRGPEGEETEAERRLDARRMASVLSLKLGQTVAGAANVLLIGIEGPPPTVEALDEMMRELRHDAETTDPETLLRKGFRHRGEYLRRLGHLSAIAVCSAPSPDAFEILPPTGLWRNPQARIPLAKEVSAALGRALGGPA